jgi:iron complex transport system substrate-binding protein
MSIRHLSFLLICSLGFLLNHANAAENNDQKSTTEKRIVTLGGAITETVYALGAGEHIVAVDASSTHPNEATTKEQVGYYRQISAEGVLALNPTKILASDDSGPAAAIDQLKNSNVGYMQIKAAKTREQVIELIQTVGKSLGDDDKTAALLEEVQSDFTKLDEFLEGAEEKPRTLIVMARGPGALHVAGKNTSGDEVINMAGGTNAADFQGFRPLNNEGLLVLQPDVVVLMAPTMSDDDARKMLLGHQGMALTPAGQSGRLHVMDGLYLLGFGPRQGKAALDLAALLHPDLAKSKELAKANEVEAK